MPGIPPRALVWPALALAMLGLGASRARASCGDYVMIGGRHQDTTVAHSGQAEAAEGATAGSEQSPRRSQPCPCRGAECSQPPASWPAPAPPVRVPLERDSLLAAYRHPSLRAELIHPLFDPSISPRSIYSPADIFRPPRLAA